jgi:hypothetical protein
MRTGSFDRSRESRDFEVGCPCTDTDLVAKDESALRRARNRREQAWFLGALLVVAAAVVAAPWLLGALERVDGVTATVAAVGVVAALIATRHRRGVRWTALRILMLTTVLAAAALCALVVACAADGCFN